MLQPRRPSDCTSPQLCPAPSRRYTNSESSGTGFVCADVNECATNNGGCATYAICTNTAGSRTCECVSG